MAAFSGGAVSVNAWSSNLLLLGMQLPDWLPIIAAIAATVAVYARSKGAELSPKLPNWLLIYAIVHVVLFGFMIWENGRGSVGVGSFAMVIALFGLRHAIRKAESDSPQAAPQKVPIL